MNEGPFRMPESADKNTGHKPPEPTPRHPEESRPVKEEPKTVQRPSASHRIGQEENPLRRFILPAVAVVVVLVIVTVGWFAWSGMQAGGTAIDSSKYQAVFFTNGQVYFGKLHTFNDEYMKMTDIFYLQSQSTDTTDSKNPQQTSSNQNNPTLIKLGEEIHGPTDEMIISKNQVLFYENLKSDGKVAKSIDKYKHPN